MHNQTGSVKYSTKEIKKTDYERARIRRGSNKEKQPDLQFRPFFDENGIITIGGRLDKSNLNIE